MNLLGLSIKLKAENIQSFIDDFLNLKDIKISDIKLFDDMILIDKIKYKAFSFSLGLSIYKVEDGILSIKVKSLKAIKVPISIFTVNFVLKILLNKINLEGVTSDGGSIIVNLSTIFKKFNISFLALDIDDIEIKDGEIEVKLKNIDVNMNEVLSKKDSKKILDDEHINKECEENIKEVVDDKEFYEEESVKGENMRGFNKEDKGYFLEYTRVRGKIISKNFREENKEILGKILFLLPDICVLNYRLLRDKRVKKGLKVLITLTIVYILNPIDYINKKFKFLDKIDDYLLILFTLNRVFTSVPYDILKYHFEGDEDTLEFLIEAFDLLNNLLGLDRLNRLYIIFEKFIR